MVEQIEVDRIREPLLEQRGLAGPAGPNRKKLWRPVEGISRDLGYMLPFYDVKRE